MIQKLKKKCLIFCLIVQLSVGMLAPFGFVRAISVTGAINDAMDMAEDRYGYDPNILRRTKQKVDAPQVLVFFDNNNPQEGEKVTATAVPSYFKDNLEEHYYTWYIIHTDSDGSPTNTVEEGKIEAMGRVARGSFDPVLFDVDYSQGGDSDNDGFVAPYGGVNGTGAKRMDTSDANDNDRDGVDNGADNCPDDYNPNQSDIDKDGKGDVCDGDIDGDGIGNNNSQNSSGVCTNTDNCAYVFNPGQEDSDGDGLGDACDLSSGDYVDSDYDRDGVGNSEDNCPKECNPQQQDSDGDGLGDVCDGNDNSNDSDCKIGDYEQFSQKGTVDTECITRCYRHNFGTKSDINYVEAGADTSSGKDQVIECQHKFPIIEGTQTIKAGQSGGGTYTVNCSQYRIGDGNFSTEEEACWRLDPTNPDTDGDGVIDEEDLAGLNQQQFTWSYQAGDRVGVIVEGTSMIPTNEDSLNSYYKIMWAEPGICTSENSSFLGNDECDGSGDYQFNYLETDSVDEDAQDNLEAGLTVSPENVQFNSSEEDYSDMVTVSAQINNEAVDDDYVYFDWKIFRCEGSNSDNCTTNEVYDPNNPSNSESKSLNLTSNCEMGKDNELGDCGVELFTPISGMGVKEIQFRPKKAIMDNAGATKVYFKVIATTRRKESDGRYSVSDTMFPITQSDLSIQLYSVTKNDAGEYVYDKEICNQGLYSRMCPVYPFQVIAAKASSTSNIESYNWQLNGSALTMPQSCSFDSCSLGAIAYFPVEGEDLFIGSISVTAKRDSNDNEDLVAQRIFSINQPLGLVYTNDVSAAWPFVKYDGTEAKDVFEAYPETKVGFRSDLVPNYLSMSDVKFTWMINGAEVTDDFIASNPDWEIELDSENNISFKTIGKVGQSVNLTAKVEKEYSESDKTLLKDSWNIIDTHNLINENTVKIKMVFPDEFYEQGTQTSSLKLFFASTVKNAPEYIVFALRLSVSLVLIWSLLVGMSMGVKVKY